MDKQIRQLALGLLVLFLLLLAVFWRPDRTPAPAE